MRMTIQRDEYLNRLVSKIGNGMIKVITGIRRCGKSFLLFTLFHNYLLEHGVEEECIIPVALDDDDFKDLRNPDLLKDYIKQHMTDSKKMYYILLAEAQFAISKEEMKDRDQPIRLYGILSGLMRKGNADVYVTGSNSRFLSSDIRTEFRDRGDTIHIAPLSFSEYFAASGLEKSEAWRDYTYYGGLPHVLFEQGDVNKTKYLANLNEQIYLADLVEHNDLKDDTGMRELMQVIASAIGSPLNPSKIANTFASNKMKGVSEPTIKKYIKFLDEAFIVKAAERYDVKGRKHISTQPKYYYTDIGLRNAILNFRQQEESHIMENIIYNELVHRGLNVDTGVTYKNFVKDGHSERRQFEVDFVVNNASSRVYIQSALMTPDQVKMDQELESLRQIPDAFRKVVITSGNFKPWYNEEGILFVPLFGFLLDKNLLEKMF